MPERVTEEALRAWESLEGCAAGSEWVPKLERMGEKLPEAIVEIRRQQRAIAALMGALQPFLKFNSSEEWTDLKVRSEDVKRARSAVANLSATAEVHDRRVKAEALEAVAMKLDKADFKYFILDSAIKVVRDEAARLREEAGR